MGKSWIRLYNIVYIRQIENFKYLRESVYYRKRRSDINFDQKYSDTASFYKKFWQTILKKFGFTSRRMNNLF